MKKNLLMAFLALVSIVRVAAQTATVTPSTSTYDAAGGQITFTVAITYPAVTNSIIGVSLKPIMVDKVIVGLESGSGYTSAPTVTFGGVVGSGATATATVSGGAVTGFTVTNGGSGYARNTPVTLTGGGGSGAIAQATVQALTLALLAKPPAATWTYLSTGGANVPEVKPFENDTTDSPNSADGFGWSYLDQLDPPANSVSFTFVLRYPPGLTGNQVVTFSAHSRLTGASLTSITVPSLTFTPTPAAPTITTQPANATVASGAAANFIVAASGFPVPTFKWQRSVDAASSTFIDLANDSTFSGVATASLTIAATTTAMNGLKFRAIATNGTSPDATSNSATLTITQTPTISTQALGQNVVVGGTATFSVAATGLPAPTYQWYFTPTGSSTPLALNDSSGKLAGTRTSSLTVSNVQSSDTGDYVCIATNTGGSATSVAAQLSIVDRVVRVAGQTAAPGASITVPIQLIAHGEENALGFSLTFDTALLTYQSAVLGAGAADAALNINLSQVTSGKLGVALAKPAGVAWTAGTQEVVKVTFLLSATAPNGTFTPINFGNTPIAQEVASVTASTLPAGYQPGNITVLAGFEADMNGSGTLTITDWVKVGRIVAGLDPAPTGVDFMKADCAPRSTLGSGTLTISDWVQAGRYAAGLDPLTPVGGPSNP